MPTYNLDDMAHAIVNGKSGIIGVLKGMGLGISDDADEESVFRLVLEHTEDERVEKELAKILREKPYNRHCLHCFEPIQAVYEKGQAIRKSMNEKII